MLICETVLHASRPPQYSCHPQDYCLGILTPPRAPGRPRTLTDEQREASRVAQNRKRTLVTNARKKARRAAKAIAEGRAPGQVGQPRILSDEQRVEYRKRAIERYRLAHAEEIRVRDAELHRNRRIARAIAEGRTPGRIGREVQFTAAERRERARRACLAYWEKYPEKRPILARKYYQENKQAVAANTHRRRARKLGNGGEHTAADILALFDKQNGICLACDKPLDENSHVDHWIPLALGGSNGPENLTLLHAKCNLRKGAKHPAALGLVRRPAR